VRAADGDVGSAVDVDRLTREVRVLLARQPRQQARHDDRLRGPAQGHRHHLRELIACFLRLHERRRHRGDDDAGADGVEWDAGACPLGRDRLRAHPLGERSLGGCVDQPPGLPAGEGVGTRVGRLLISRRELSDELVVDRHERGHRGHDHRARRFRPAKQRAQVLERCEGAEVVDPHRQRGRQGDARDRDDRVETIRSDRPHRIREPRTPFRRREVGVDVGVVQVEPDHPGAALGEQIHGGLADTRRRPGDEVGAHVPDPFRRRRLRRSRPR
jgi:hypothetical protein